MGENPLGWGQAAITTLTNVWQVVIGPTALALWAVYKLLVGQKETAEQRQEAETKRLMDRGDGLLATALARVEADNAALRKVALDQEAENARLRGLMWGWYNKAHSIWHDWANIVTMQDRTLAKAGLEELAEAKWPARPASDVNTP